MKASLVEKLAKLEHEQWSHWIEFQNSVRQAFSHSQYELMWEKWLKLARTPYSELSEEQKESDREWARKVIEILEKQR